MSDKSKFNEDAAGLHTLPRHLSYAAVVDSRDGEIEITEHMIRQACREAEKWQQFPFAVDNY